MVQYSNDFSEIVSGIKIIANNNNKKTMTNYKITMYKMLSQISRKWLM